MILCLLHEHCTQLEMSVASGLPHGLLQGVTLDTLLCLSRLGLLASLATRRTFRKVSLSQDLWFTGTWSNWVYVCMYGTPICQKISSCKVPPLTSYTPRWSLWGDLPLKLPSETEYREIVNPCETEPTDRNQACSSYFTNHKHHK